MELFRCCCGWSYVIGRKQVYGAIYRAGIGDFPDQLANTQRMMTRAEFEDWYSDCAACYRGHHKHQRPGNVRA
jgi:hypothetical protein